MLYMRRSRSNNISAIGKNMRSDYHALETIRDPSVNQSYPTSPNYTGCIEPKGKCAIEERYISLLCITCAAVKIDFFPSLVKEFLSSPSEAGHEFQQNLTCCTALWRTVTLGISSMIACTYMFLAQGVGEQAILAFRLRAL